MSTKITKAKEVLAKLEGKVKDLSLDLAELEKTIAAKKAELGGAVLDGGDSDKLGGELAKLETRQTTLTVTAETAMARHAQAAQALAEALVEDARKHAQDITAESQELVLDMISILNQAESRAKRAAELIDESRTMKINYGISGLMANADVLKAFVALSVNVQAAIQSIIYSHPEYK